MMNDGDDYVRAGEYRIPKEPLRFPDPDPLAGAQVFHLQPDDIVVLRMPAPGMITPALAQAAREVFTPRRVVVLAPGVDVDPGLRERIARWLRELVLGTPMPDHVWEQVGESSRFYWLRVADDFLSGPLGVTR